MSEDSKTTNSTKDSRKRGPRVVVFKARPSPYDDLVEKDPNIQVFYNVCTGHILVFCVVMAAFDSYTAGRLTWDWSHITRDLGSWTDMAYAAGVEAIILSITIAIHPFFKLWVAARRNLGKMADKIFLLLLAGVLVVSFPGTVFVCFHFKFPVFLRIFIVIEQIRVVVKVYAFVRENSMKILYPWNKDDEEGNSVIYEGQMSPSVGSFRQYCYFLFAPTLLYRDHYPRNTGAICWRKVLKYLLQVLSTIYVGGTAYRKLLYPASLLYKDLLMSVLLSLPFGFILMFLASVGIFHGINNFSAELMRFADRQFYTDWWTSRNYATFYRKWNNVVHHCIHQYLYQDVKKMVKTPVLAVILSSILSSVLHEYVMYMALGFVLPILTLLFLSFGMIFLFCNGISPHFQNLGLITGLTVGFSVIPWIYIVEYNARFLCQREETMMDIVLPRSLECIQAYN